MFFACHNVSGRNAFRPMTTPEYIEYVATHRRIRLAPFYLLEQDHHLIGEELLEYKGNADQNPRT